MGFNRPDKIRQLIGALRTTAPQKVLLAVDGPRENHPQDAHLVKEVQSAVQLIDWTDDVQTLFRETNLGLRQAVTEAVTWAISDHGRVIVLEDDCIPGSSCVPFMQAGLQKYKDESTIGHINGYNLVPAQHISHNESPIRLTRYIESYAWATWGRAWASYDDSLEWALNCSLSELAQVVGSKTAAIRWKINFHDAATGRINTWAYRWMATLWSKNLSTISPNVNLSAYDGHEGGTHTRRRVRWTELPVVDGSSIQADELSTAGPDPRADAWTGHTVFRENFPGIVEGVAASIAMEVLRRARS